MLGLLARKVPLVAVKTSKTTVSVSVGPNTAFSVGGMVGGGNFPKSVSGIEVKIDGAEQASLAPGATTG